MGNKDKTRDGDAATTKTSHSRANRDHSQDWETSRDAALAKTIAEAVALQTKSIVELFSKQKAEETQSITEAFSRQMERHMRNTRSFSRKVTHSPCQLPLKSLHLQMDLE